jgi:hypothetical protein
LPAKNKISAPNPKVELYEKLIETIPNLERKGDANPHTSINGILFTRLHPETDWPSSCRRIGARSS